MISRSKKSFLLSAALAVVILIILPHPARSDFVLGPEELVQADGVEIDVPGYSVPSFVFWNSDTLKDLVVGEGGGGVADGKVRVYLNIGTPGYPLFGNYFYVQSSGSDLVSPGAG
jgi:hypothetical protein